MLCMDAIKKLLDTRFGNGLMMLNPAEGTPAVLPSLNLYRSSFIVYTSSLILYRSSFIVYTLIPPPPRIFR
jgi:hypothetical protein